MIKKSLTGEKSKKELKINSWLNILNGLFILLLFSPEYSFTQSIYFQSDSTSTNFGKIIITDLNSEGQTIGPKVFLESEWKLRGENGIAIIGRTSKKNEQLIFSPLLSFQPNQSYVATYPGIAPFFFSPNLNTTSTTLNAIYPTKDTLPANQLKFYLDFSSPMSIGKIHNYISLLDESGTMLSQPFLEMQTELWDSSQQRLTLWLDPGRIKRDLKPNLTLGQPLSAGTSYTLLVSKNWKNAEGKPLGKDYEKTFHVNVEDRKKPEVAQWKIISPQSNSLKPLVIHTNESLDFGSARYAGTISQSEKIFEGYWTFLPEQKGWQFHPSSPWETGQYSIRFNNKLEDLAGNNLIRLFDQESSKASKNIPPVSKNFVIK